MQSHYERQACPRCGKGPVSSRLHDQTFPFGEGTEEVILTATVPLRTCEACGLEYIDHEAEVARHRAVCKHLGVLEPERIRLIRHKYGLTRAAFARITGLGEATLARWERGSLIQNIANDRYLRLLEAQEVFEKLVAIQESQDMGPSRDRPVFRVLQPSDADLRDPHFRVRSAS